jgi:hypothetical protein
VLKTVIYKPKGVTLLDYSDKLKDYPERLSTLIAEKLATVISTHVFFYSSGPTSVSHLKTLLNVISDVHFNHYISQSI